MNLANGTNGFSTNADSGSETYAIECPASVSPCPSVSGTGASAGFSVTERMDQFWLGVFSAKYSWLSALSSALIGSEMARALAAA